LERQRFTLLVDRNLIYTHTRPRLGKQLLSATLNQSKYCGNQIAIVYDLMSNKTNLIHLPTRGFDPFYISISKP
jgi:hypothetical protein